MVTGQFVSIGKKLAKPEGFHRAYTKTVYPETPLFSPTEWTAYSLMRAADRLGVMRNLGSIYSQSLADAEASASGFVFRRQDLNEKLKDIYDLPDVQVADWRPPTINVMVPAFDFHSASAGLFGVFQLAKFLAKIGNHVRLVFFENFVFSELIKQRYNKGLSANFYYLRNSKGVEIDCVCEKADKRILMEIKLSQTLSPSHFKNIDNIRKSLPNTESYLIYSGEQEPVYNNVKCLNWKNIANIL